MKGKAKIIFSLVGIALFLIIGSGLIVGAKIFTDVKGTERTINKNVAETKQKTKYVVKETNKKDNSVYKKDAKSISLLLMGIDSDSNIGRADTLIYVTVNKYNRVKMFSIPRDSYVKIIGKGTTDKINHAYAFGGNVMEINTVQNLLNIPIDYYVTVNLNGLAKLVDIVGGVTVYNNMAFKSYTYYYRQGTINLSGAEALEYVRMRKNDPKGDFGRQQRQQDVIKVLVKKLASTNSIMQYNSILDALGDNVQSNVTIKDAMSWLKTYDVQNLKYTSEQFNGKGVMINDIYYYKLDSTDLKNKQNLIKKELSAIE